MIDVKFGEDEIGQVGCVDVSDVSGLRRIMSRF